MSLWTSRLLLHLGDASNRLGTVTHKDDSIGLEMFQCAQLIAFQVGLLLGGRLVCHHFQPRRILFLQVPANLLGILAQKKA